MPQTVWEYAVVDYDTDIGDYRIKSDEPYNIDGMGEQEMLAFLGRIGWELVGVTAFPSGYYSYYLKRPKEATA